MISRRRSPRERLLHLVSAPLVACILSATDGLAMRRRAIAAGVALVSGLLIDALLGPGPLTRADHVTRMRASLSVALASRFAVGRPATGPAPAPRRTPARAATITLAVALDAVDGAVARRTGQVTSRGGRFDLEADAVAVAVLSAMMLHLTRWAVVPGSLRYLFGAARWLVPPLRGDLAPNRARRAVAAGAMASMAASTWPFVPERAARMLVMGAACGLLASFGKDTVCLLRDDLSDAGGTPRRPAAPRRLPRLRRP